MEAKFFEEIQKNMDINTLKEFEKDLSRVLMVGECEMRRKIRDENYSWLKLKSAQKKRLFKFIDIYMKFDDIIDTVKNLNTKVDQIKELQKEE